jgi:hypothetical protein
MFVRSRLMDMAVSVLLMISSERIKTTRRNAILQWAIAERVDGFRLLPRSPHCRHYSTRQFSLSALEVIAPGCCAM